MVVIDRKRRSGRVGAKMCIYLFNVGFFHEQRSTREAWDKVSGSSSVKKSIIYRLDVDTQYQQTGCSFRK